MNTLEIISLTIISTLIVLILFGFYFDKKENEKIDKILKQDDGYYRIVFEKSELEMFDVENNIDFYIRRIIYIFLNKKIGKFTDIFEGNIYIEYFNNEKMIIKFKK